MNEKKSDILFINLPILLNRDFIDYPYFVNLGPILNASILKEEGYDVTMLDSFALEDSDIINYNDKYYLLGVVTERIIELIKKKSFKIVVIGNNSFLNLPATNTVFYEVIRNIKGINPTSLIILADCHCGSMHYIDYSAEEVIKKYPQIDYVIKYETEKKLLLLINYLIKGASKIRMKKLDFSNKVIFGNLREINMSELPFYDWSLINVSHYYSFLIKVFKKLNRPSLFSLEKATLPFISSRGCIYNCIFCTNNPGSKGGKVYRKYNASYLKEILLNLKNKYKVQKLIILDGMANADEKHFSALLKILKEEGLKYDFPNGLRADKLKKENLFLMKDFISTLSISAESGSQKVINETIEKNQSLFAVEKVANWCKELNIPLLIHYIIGIPGEKRSDIAKTLNFAFKMYKKYGSIPSVQFAVPIKGTRLYELCKKENILMEENVEDYSSQFSERYIINSNELNEEILKKYMNNFHLMIESDKTKKVIINLTYKCNNNCIFCAVGDRDKIDGDYNKYCRLLKKYFDLGCQLVDFDGGEPTLFPGIFSIIDYVVRLGYQRINVTSNGRLFANRDFAARFLLSGITDLLISIHGHTADIHNANTKTESFMETLSGIKNVIKLKPRRISFGINTTLTKVNYIYLEDLIKLILDLGCDRLNVQFVTPFGRATSDIVPSPKEVVPILKKVIDKYKFNLKINIINLPFCFMENYEEYLNSDVFKYGRDMVFVGNEIVNLARYLASRRVRIKKCNYCPYSIVCEGIYKFK